MSSWRHRMVAPTLQADPAQTLPLDETRPERILVVDDDPDIRRLLVRLLANGGYDVRAAADSDEALSAVQDPVPDLVLLDVSMPGRDGVEICREIQHLGLGSRTPPVIFLSALGTTRHRVDGLEAGGTDYIVKPFEPDEVRARVRAALRAKALRDALAIQALTDPLTGLVNRRQLDSRLADLFALARRHGRSLACLMVDVDHFKRVNDTYGHSAGDAVLREVANRLRAQCRGVDVVARYGGEEFTVLLPETDGPGALVAAERIRAAIEAEPVLAWRSVKGPLQPGMPATEAVTIPLTASLGVAALVPAMDRPEALYAAADAALYRAKESGRNRVLLA
jgi:two-component system, cell cycle response regulator